jgi:hypothetical protein
MALKNSKFTIKKFDGDSAGSYAVFRKEAVKGKGSIIFYGEAQPIVCGLTRREADYYRSRCDAGDLWKV